MMEVAKENGQDQAFKAHVQVMGKVKVKEEDQVAWVDEQ